MQKLDRLLAGWSARVARSPRLRAAVPPWLEGLARRRLMPRLGKPLPAVLEERLWGGFSAAALADLAALADAGPPAEAAEAAWVLGRWSAAHGDFAAGLGFLKRMRELHAPAARDRRQYLLEALFLAQLGRGAEARARLEAAPAAGFDVSRALVLAGSWAPEAMPEAGAPEAEAALREINAVFRQYGLQEVTRRDPALPLGLDNLRGRDPGPKDAPQGRRHPGRVTVIVPAFAAEATLATALAGLSEQTHGDLEVIVVDDASPDGTADVAADAARADPRVRLLRQAENAGGYVARNRALAAASGAFVTVHDADDWSHPERIARQLRALGPGMPSTFSDWVRTSPGLGFLGPARVLPDLVGHNDSAALFRRDLFERFGAWDTARIAADKELIWRFEHLAGRPREGFRRRRVLPGCPLAFGRLAPASLTRTGATHVLTVYHGLRREYREAAAFWQDGLDVKAIRRQGWRATAPFFPAPPVLRATSNAAPSPAHDLLFLADFNFRGGTQKSALAMIAAARAAGLSAAALQYRRLDQDLTEPLDARVRARFRDLGVRVVAPGEALKAETVVLTYPPILAHAMDRFPAVAHQRLAVVVNQLAARDRAGADQAYDPLAVRANLAALLGGEGAWIPISARVRAAMAADRRYPAADPDTWTPLLDPGAGPPPPPVPWRGGSRARPVLGRHGRDHPLKWPRDPEALRAAYCALRPCEVRFLGGAWHARARLDAASVRWPGNWRVLPFGAMPVPEFLAGLDLFLHFPDPDYVEEFGRAPMEAMAAGVPVILPPDFAPTFGAAALYAEPAEVWDLAAAVFADRGLWEARAAAGRAFVAAACDPALFPARLARLKASS